MGKRGRQAKDLKERLLSKRIIVGTCWMWSGQKNNMGYGVIGLGHDKMSKVHRVAYEVFKGSLVKPLVCHSCDHPACFNPDHLWNGTQKDNLQDMTRKGRRRNQFSVRRS